MECINVESKEDVKHLVSEFTVSAFQSLALQKDDVRRVAQASNRSPEDVQLAIEQRLDLWINNVFSLASDSIRVNGMSVTAAFEDIQGTPLQLTIEFEPLDEQIRQEADNLQTQVQETLVRIAGYRKSVPKQLDQAHAEALMTSHTLPQSQPESQEIQTLNRDEIIDSIIETQYPPLCLKQQTLSQVLYFLTQTISETLEKSTQLKSLIDSIGIPEVPPLVSNARQFKRRRSSIGAALIKGDPAKVSSELLRRLEGEKLMF